MCTKDILVKAFQRVKVVIEISRDQRVELGADLQTKVRQSVQTVTCNNQIESRN